MYVCMYVYIYIYIYITYMLTHRLLPRVLAPRPHRAVRLEHAGEGAEVARQPAGQPDSVRSVQECDVQARAQGAEEGVLLGELVVPDRHQRGHPHQRCAAGHRSGQERRRLGRAVVGLRLPLHEHLRHGDGSETLGDARTVLLVGLERLRLHHRVLLHGGSGGTTCLTHAFFERGD